MTPRPRPRPRIAPPDAACEALPLQGGRRTQQFVLRRCHRRARLSYAGLRVCSAHLGRLRGEPQGRRCPRLPARAQAEIVALLRVYRERLGLGPGERYSARAWEQEEYGSPGPSHGALAARYGTSTCTISRLGQLAAGADACADAVSSH